MFPITEAWDGNEINDAILEEYNADVMEINSNIVDRAAGAVGIGAATHYGVNKITNKLDTYKTQNPQGFKQRAKNALISTAKGAVRAAGAVGSLYANKKYQDYVSKHSANEAWNGYEIDDSVLEEYNRAQLETSRGKEKNITPKKDNISDKAAKVAAAAGAGYALYKGGKYLYKKAKNAVNRHRYINGNYGIG